MANDLQIKKRTEVIRNQIQSILRTIARDYESGRFKSEAELQHRVYQDVQAFYESIGRPTFVPIKAWGPPYSDDHNGMIKQIFNDLMTLYSEANGITEDLKKTFEQVELERQSFENRLKRVSDVMKGIELNLNEASSKVIFRDYFADHDHYAKEMVKGTPAHLSANEGLLTLARTESETYNEYATITILEGNGFPGNTHIVRSSNDTLKFDGQEELHINLADILDGNSDTWFEYEIFELTERSKQISEMKGFEYKEAVRWISDGGELRMVIRIELSRAMNMNWISLSPFIPSDKGAIAAQIEKVIVSDEKGSVHTMGNHEMFDSEKGYLFPRQKCKTITIYLNQRSAYETEIGHLFYKQLNKDSMTVMGANSEKDGIRVHGSAPSIQNLGVVYDANKKEILYPVKGYGATVDGVERRKQELFSVPIMPNDIHAGLEKLSAWRYVIGMRDVNLASYQFDTTSEYVSKPFYASQPIRKVELEVDVDIPALFDPEENWIRYFISVDEGQSWHEIFPRNIFRPQQPNEYLFNSGIPKEGRLPEVGYIETLHDIHAIQLKIEMKRPEFEADASFYTPIVYGYELHVMTGEANI